MLCLDGSQGEGGGQILRTALGLSLVTGTPFRIDNIRAGRARPGLMRQHLTALEAAACIGKAEVSGAEIGSRTVQFTPRGLRTGAHQFSVGTAGSTTLVLQTILPALLCAAEPSQITLEGGTHNSASPPFDFLSHAYLPLVRRMGVTVQAAIERPGFYPAGGGRFTVNVAPAHRLSAFDLDTRGPILRTQARVLVANLPRAIGERELARLAERLHWESKDLVIEPCAKALGPGNVVMLEIESASVTEVFTGFGEKGVPAETVADRAADEALAYLANNVPVGPHLCDQLILLLALARAGSFHTCPPTPHAHTQLSVIGAFLGNVVRGQEVSGGRWRFSAN